MILDIVHSLCFSSLVPICVPELLPSAPHAPLWGVELAITGCLGCHGWNVAIALSSHATWSAPPPHPRRDIEVHLTSIQTQMDRHFCIGARPLCIEC